MNEPVELHLSATEPVIHPPIVDLLAHDAQLRAYVTEFVPDPHVSTERKESLLVPDGTPTARRIGELLEELTKVLRAPSRVVKLAHAGRDNFDFYTERGEALHLHDSPSPQHSFDVYAILQVIAQEVQLEFLAQHRTGRIAG